jgi:hypothetical protein
MKELQRNLYIWPSPTDISIRVVVSEELMTVNSARLLFVLALLGDLSKRASLPDTPTRGVLFFVMGLFGLRFSCKYVGG